MTPESVGSTASEGKPLRREWVRWTAFVLVALAAIFYVPLLFPVAPSISDSYIFGYNNRIGVLLLFLFLLLGGLFSKSLRVTFHAAVSPKEKIPRKQVWRWMGIFTAGWAVMYFLMRGLEGFGESIYLIDRIKMLAAGGTPYKDFEFAYGPLFLYGPRLLMLLHLGVEASYYIFWLILLLSGTWILAQTINQLDYPTTRRRELFHLLCFFAVPAIMSTGLNYTLFRFVLSPYLALLVYRIDRHDRLSSRGIALLASVASTVFLLLVSPEMGLSFAAGIIGYFALFGIFQGRFSRPAYGVLYLAFLLTQACVLWATARLDLFSTLKQFSSGAFSFPIIPAGHILFFFFCCGLVTLYIAARLRSRSSGDGLLMVLAVSAGSIFAAMGRCDVSHVGFAAIGILLVATLLASSMPHLWKIYRIVFIVLLVFIPTIELRAVYQEPLTKTVFLRALHLESQTTQTRLDKFAERSMSRHWGQPEAHRRLAALKFLSSFAFNGDQGARYNIGSGIFEVPFGYTPTRFGNYHSPWMDTGRFLGLDNAFTPETLQWKIDEIRAHPDRDLIVPEDFKAECNIDKEGEQHFITKLFVYPYYGRVKHRENLRDPLCDYIAGNYHLLREAQPLGYGYQIWGRRDQVP